MKIYIRNMVCLRCKIVVKSILNETGICYRNVELGEVNLCEEIHGEKMSQLRLGLQQTGLELIEDHRAILVEKIKAAAIEMVHSTENLPSIKCSVYLSEKLQYNYSYLSNLFSEIKGITLEHFIIVNKIERAKELILYNELNLKEIAYKLNYSSSAHLSNQFKKITGLTPSFFKKVKQRRMVSIEDL